MATVVDLNTAYGRTEKMNQAYDRMRQLRTLAESAFYSWLDQIGKGNPDLLRQRKIMKDLTEAKLMRAQRRLEQIYAQSTGLASASFGSK